MFLSVNINSGLKLWVLSDGLHGFAGIITSIAGTCRCLSEKYEYAKEINSALIRKLQHSNPEFLSDNILHIFEKPRYLSKTNLKSMDTLKKLPQL
jgi:hypothetical protein